MSQESRHHRFRQLRVEVEAMTNLIKFRLFGEVDIAVSGELSDLFVRETGDGRADAECDLTGVTYMDSTGLSVLIRLHQQLQSHRRELILRTPKNGQLNRIFEIAGLDEILTIEPTAEEH